MLEYAGVTEAFDKAKESLNRKYTQRYNIEKSSKHREKHEKIFDTIIEEKKDPTGADLELFYSMYSGKSPNDSIVKEVAKRIKDAS